MTSWLLSVLPLMLGIVAVTLVLFTPRTLGKTIRRTWRTRRPSHRRWWRDHTHTARRCPACRAAAGESAPHLIEVNYLLPDAAPRRPKAGPK